MFVFILWLKIHTVIAFYGNILFNIFSIFGSELIFRFFCCKLIVMCTSIYEMAKKNILQFFKTAEKLNKQKNNHFAVLAMSFKYL